MSNTDWDAIRAPATLGAQLACGARWFHAVAAFFVRFSRFAVVAEHAYIENETKHISRSAPAPVQALPGGLPTQFSRFEVSRTRERRGGAELGL